MDIYRIYGASAGRYECAYDYEDAQKIAEGYEFMGTFAWIVRTSADGRTRTIISDGSQATRAIAQAAKFWKKAEINILKWWISVYTFMGADFAADLELIEKRLAEVM